MKHEKTIAVIGAMDSEVAQLVAALSSPETVPFGNLTLHIGKQDDKRIIIVKCGVGKVNAARCTQLLIDRFAPDYIINSGIAGGVNPALKVEDVVIATDLVQHDFDVSAFGYAKGNLCDRDRADEPTAFIADEVLSARLMQTAREMLPQKTVLRGRIASGDVFVSDLSHRKAIYDIFAADAAEMEGAAIAQTAQYAGVPFAVLRVVSDCADGSAVESFDAFEQQTADQSALLINGLLKKL